MRARLPVLLAIAVVATLDSSPAPAQTVVDRVVGLNGFGKPLIITQLEAGQIFWLAAATGVSIGFEGAPLPQSKVSIAATNKPLRDVLDAIQVADPRYEWREDRDVIVIRPAAAWSAPASPLDNGVGGMTLSNVIARDAQNIVAQILGLGRRSDLGGLPDTRRFSVEVPDGGTLLDMLNAIVRAHGSLSWAFGPSPRQSPSMSAMFLMSNGSDSSGFGVPIGAVFDGQVRSVPDTSRAPVTVQSPLLDRLVKSRATGMPVIASRLVVNAVLELATAVAVPMGFEDLPPSERPPDIDPRQPVPPAEDPPEGWLTLTGMTLRAALDALVTLDPQYEWRDMDGVIVLRPVTAWRDSTHPLFRLVGSVQLEGVPVSKAIAAFGSMIGSAELGQNDVSDTRAISVDFPQGTALDLLNAIARSHGELSWEWAENTAAERKIRGTGRYTVTFHTPGRGAGISVK